jgi:hypothetical protein
LYHNNKLTDIYGYSFMYKYLYILKIISLFNNNNVAYILITGVIFFGHDVTAKFRRKLLLPFDNGREKREKKNSRRLIMNAVLHKLITTQLS